MSGDDLELAAHRDLASRCPSEDCLRVHIDMRRKAAEAYTKAMERALAVLRVYEEELRRRTK